ncbi:hypothetical protein [Aliterella atlantica]|uniref:Uncharacterized protein n=1 Tax=Aliterella atlantica CENA595 TaxID=1618023 RepID=A0A0D8ZNF6_9CYAN|nr:hypothetical protein [Aliterella atlantica]KJH70014.1 hypothetical protein UH38_20500 [Aliterella atlantica CENA595]
MSYEEWHSAKSGYKSVLENIPRLGHTYLAHMPWLIDQIIESKYALIFFPGRSHMNLFIQPTFELDIDEHYWIVIHPKASWFTLHYCYLDGEDIFTYDEYKVVLKEVKNLLLKLMERLEQWKLENLPI